MIKHINLGSKKPSRVDRNIVISQPMFFPWLGFLELVKCADDYVNYHDVDFSKGSFSNRVQLKGPSGSVWMTVPLRLKDSPSKKINQVLVDNRKNWKKKHLDQLDNLYKNAKYHDLLMDLVGGIYEEQFLTLSDIAWKTCLELFNYFRLSTDLSIHNIVELDIKGSSSERVLELVTHLRGNNYISAHGGLSYLNHESFTEKHIEVSYINYSLTEYTQQNGEFNPYVSSLDAIANLGPSATQLLNPTTTPWRLL